MRVERVRVRVRGSPLTLRRLWLELGFTFEASSTRRLSCCLCSRSGDASPTKASVASAEASIVRSRPWVRVRVRVRVRVGDRVRVRVRVGVRVNLSPGLANPNLPRWNSPHSRHPTAAPGLVSEGWALESLAPQHQVQQKGAAAVLELLARRMPA